MNPRRAMWLVVAVTAALRLALAPIRALSFDEAYYLCAARGTARIGDHPPLLLWLLRAADHVPFGVEVRVRLVAVVCQALTVLGVARLARRLASDETREQAGLFAALFATWGLMPWAGGLIATPDAPLLAACAWLFALAAEEEPRLVPLAIVSAVALASKVSAVIVIAAVGLALPFRIAPALFVGAVVAAPLALHSALLQAQHAMGRGPLVSAPEVGAVAAVSGFVVSGFVLWSPPIWVLASSRSGRSTLRAIPGAIAAGAVTLALVLASAVVSGRPPEPNWIAPAMLPLFAVAGVVLSRRETAREVRAHLAVHVVPAVIGIAAWIAPPLLPPALDPLARAPHDVARLPAAPRPAYAVPSWACVYPR